MHVCLISSGRLSEEELRPFLNCHFLSARLLSKAIPVPPSSPDHASTVTDGPSQQGDKARFIKASLRRYQWLVDNGPKLCERKEVVFEEVFGLEGRVCADMAQLLPAKIDRMHHLGEHAFGF